MTDSYELRAIIKGAAIVISRARGFMSALFHIRLFVCMNRESPVFLPRSLPERRRCSGSRARSALFAAGLFVVNPDLLNEVFRRAAADFLETFYKIGHIFEAAGVARLADGLSGEQQHARVVDAHALHILHVIHPRVFFEPLAKIVLAEVHHRSGVVQRDLVRRIAMRPRD